MHITQPGTDPVLAQLEARANHAEITLAMERARQNQVIESKHARKDIDAIIQRIKRSDRNSDERNTAIHYLKIAEMFLGLDLKALGEANPYPNSRNTTNSEVDPTADNLKF